MRITRLYFLLVIALAAALQGCVGVAAVGVGAGVASALDRRTTGAQVDDEGIELRATNRISERFGDRVHVNVTSFNRSVLITGEAPDAKTRDEIDKIVASVPNARAVTNDMEIRANTTLGNRANDATITGKVKARFLDARKFNALHVKKEKVFSQDELATFFTQFGVSEQEFNKLYNSFSVRVKVRQAEAADAVEIARTTEGVRKVVRMFDFCKPTDAACAPRDKAKAEEPKKSGS